MHSLSHSLTVFKFWLICLYFKTWSDFASKYMWDERSQYVVPPAVDTEPVACFRRTGVNTWVWHCLLCPKTLSESICFNWYGESRNSNGIGAFKQTGFDELPCIYSEISEMSTYLPAFSLETNHKLKSDVFRFQRMITLKVKLSKQF